MSTGSSPPTESRDRFAFYYPGWIWRDVAWLKNLVLFFDGVALLVPEYMRPRLALADPAIVAGLEEHGLLRVLEPETFVDRPAAEHLATPWSTSPPTRWRRSTETASAGSCRCRGWATALTQGWQRWSLLGLPSMPSAGHVVSADLQTVGVDLSSVPFDDVLAFRAEHGAEHRRYARELHRFVRELGAIEPDERLTLLAERQEALRDAAEDLRRESRSAFGTALGFALGIAGAGWTAATGDPIGAILGTGAAVAGLAAGRRSAQIDAYGYVFQARAQLAY